MCAAGGFSPGDEVAGYVIEARLGAGGFGEVYRALERSPQRRVALKVLRPELAADPVVVQRFQREANAMAAVEHANVVPIYRHGEDQGHRFVAMRYLPGGSLDAFLDERDPSFEDVVELLAGVAAGLDCCHARGIVHRDLKPANILIDVDTGSGLLTDFGIALSADLTTMTRAGGSPGTPAYMAPETVLGGRATAASDLWALAAVAYRAGTGRLPRGLGQPPDTVPVRPSRLNERLRPDVDRVLLRALSTDPGARYGDARTFISELQGALWHGRHTRTRRMRRMTPPRPGRIDPEVTRRLAPRRVWSVAGAALVLAPAAYGVSLLGGPGEIDCHPSYAGACLKPDAVDYDCGSGNGDGPEFVSGTVRVVGRDDYGLDRDGDGVAC